MIDPSLQASLESMGYTHARYIPGRGLCAIMRFMFTTGIIYDIDNVGYGGRYCYNTKQDALADLDSWTGEGDPTGPWIKHKGDVEYSNLNNDENNPNFPLADLLSALKSATDRQPSDISD